MARESTKRRVTRRSFLGVLGTSATAAALAACAQPTPTPQPPTKAPVAPTAVPATKAPVAPTVVPATKAAATTVPATAAPAKPDKVYKVLFWEHGPWTRVALPEKKDDFVYQYILKNYGLDITIQVAPQGVTEAEAAAKLNAMISAGEIPDFIEAYWTVGTPIAQQYIDQGVLIPINDYLKATPYLQKFLSPEEAAYLTLDGKQYGVAQPRPRENWDTIWIRKDWLDKLGLPLPKTTDELAAAALAFTTKDPDGNGKNDTYGFTAMQNFGSMQSIFAPFGAYPGSNNIRIADNKVVFDAFSPQAKQALTWWKAQIDAGVVDPNWTTNSTEQWRDAVAQGKAGIVRAEFQLPRFCTSTACLGEAIKAASPKADWVQLPAVKGPFGAYVCWQGGLLDVSFVFTRQAKSEPGKMEAIMRFFNDMMNPASEVYWLASHGLKDVTYKVDDKGKVVEKMTVNELAWRSYWVVFRRGDDDYFWYYKKEKVFSPRGEDVSLWDLQEFSISEPKIKNVNPLWVAHEAWPDLLVYLKEMHIKFATGKEPLDKWDAFVDTAMTKYRLKAVLDDATKQFQKLGLIK